MKAKIHLGKLKRVHRRFLVPQKEDFSNRDAVLIPSTPLNHVNTFADISGEHIDKFCTSALLSAEDI